MEDRQNFNIGLVELAGRNAALEAVQTQLMIRIASLFDQPQQFVRVVMMNAEDNLRRGRDKATGEKKAIAERAVAHFEAYSMNLIAALTPKQNAQ